MKTPAGRQLWAVLDLLDRQIVDRDGHLIGKVDDLELEIPEDGDGLPVVTAILSGAGALAGQIGGDAGRWLAAVERRVSESEEPSRIEFTLVRSIGSEIDVAGSRDELDTNRGERWARDVIIAKIPGPVMRLNDLLGREVVTTAGESLGRVHEALLVQDGPMLSEVGAAFRVHGLAVTRHATGIRLGYAQGAVQAPWLLKRLFGRPPTMVPWAAIVSLDDHRVVVDMEQVSGQPGNNV